MVIGQLIDCLHAEHGVRATPAQVRRAESLGYLSPAPSRLPVGHGGVRIYAPHHVEQMRVYREIVKPGPRPKDRLQPAST